MSRLDPSERELDAHGMSITPPPTSSNTNDKSGSGTSTTQTMPALEHCNTHRVSYGKAKRTGLNGFIHRLRSTPEYTRQFQRNLRSLWGEMGLFDNDDEKHNQVVASGDSIASNGDIQQLNSQQQLNSHPNGTTIAAADAIQRNDDPFEIAGDVADSGANGNGTNARIAISNAIGTNDAGPDLGDEPFESVAEMSSYVLVFVFVVACLVYWFTGLFHMFFFLYVFRFLNIFFFFYFLF